MMPSGVSTNRLKRAALTKLGCNVKLSGSPNSLIAIPYEETVISSDFQFD